MNAVDALLLCSAALLLNLSTVLLLLLFYVLRTVRRAAEGEPPRLEGGVPVHRKTSILVASTVSHSEGFPR